MTIEKPSLEIRDAIATQLATQSYFPAAARFLKALERPNAASRLKAFELWPGFWFETTRFWLLVQAAQALMHERPEMEQKIEERVGLGGACELQSRTSRLSYRLAFHIYKPPNYGIPTICASTTKSGAETQLCCANPQRANMSSSTMLHWSQLSRITSFLTRKQ